MSTPINDGGPAFPVDDRYHADGRVHGSNGMTLRDYFAGQALGEIIRREIREIREDRRKIDCFALEDSSDVPAHTMHLASESYAIADAMLASRERKEGAK